ncbi:MAG: EAL domain-containing protein [Hyphomicrobiales bacterium]|nr:EAL domain-containing protein [Hyphomicrobiales bacterium]
MARPDIYTRTSGAVGLVVLLTVISAGLLRWKERSDEIAAATRTASNYAGVIAEEVSNAALAVEVSLRTIAAHQVDRTSPDAFRAAGTTLAFHRQIGHALARLPQADVIAVADAKGDIIASTYDFPAPDVNVADRDYFRQLRAKSSDDMIVSAPVINKYTGRGTIYFVRGIYTPSKEFLGVAMIGAQPEFFVQTPQSLSEIPGQSFVLSRDDGVIYLRRPAGAVQMGSAMPSGSDWRATVQRGGGVYRSPGIFDNSPRYVAVRPLARYPLVITVTITEEAALAAWRRRTTMVVIAAFVLIGMLGMIFRLLRAQYNAMEASRVRLQKREAQLATTNERLETALENMSQGLAMFDRDEKLVVSNTNYADLYGVPTDAIRPGMTIDEVIAKRSEKSLLSQLPQDVFDQVVARTEVDRLVIRLSDGRSIALRRRRMPATGGWVTTHQDVTEEVERVERIEFLAMHDALTGLHNRAAFVRRLGEAVERCPAGRLSLLLIDLDAFKTINDTLGHGGGDEMLRQLSKRLLETAGEADVARFGGDEFAILVETPEGSSDARALVQRLLACALEPFEIGPRRVSASLSIGVAEVDPDCRDIEKTLRRADLALYKAKREGRNRACRFEPELETEFQSDADLVRDLREAISANSIEVHYQPIVDAMSHRIVTMEALARWTHPLRGNIPPSHFVRIAEEAGLVPSLGELVLRRACVDALCWPEDVTIAVNCSSLQISLGDFADRVGRALADSRLPPRRLELEITESTLLQKDNQNIHSLHALRDLGVSIALDDFGTGYASMSYLTMFPFDRLKIDKSFVDGINAHPGCAAIVSATTMLARTFAIRTVAEGVERPDQIETLRAAGVDLMQGYAFGRPAALASWQVHDGRIVAAAHATSAQAA